MRATVNIPGALWSILGVAVALRLLGAWCGNLMFDESAHLALADTIDLHPDRLHLVFRTLDHPLFRIALDGTQAGDGVAAARGLRSNRAQVCRENEGGRKARDDSTCQHPLRRPLARERAPNHV